MSRKTPAERQDWKPKLFIQNYTMMTAPLRKLTEKETIQVGKASDKLKLAITDKIHHY